MKTNKTKTTSGYNVLSKGKEADPMKKCCGFPTWELYSQYRNELNRKHRQERAKVNASFTVARPPSQELTVKEEDFQYRKQLREAMEEEESDMFSYTW